MRKVFSFGEIAYTGNCKSYLVTLKVELDCHIPDKPVFTVSGNVWNSSHTDTVMCGQCLDDIWQEYKQQLINPGLYKKIMGLWQRNHLNHLNAGCIHQDVLQWGREHMSVPCPICGYEYGTQWLYKPISFNDLYVIKTLLNMPLSEQEQAIQAYKGV